MCFHKHCREDASGGLFFPLVCRGSCSLSHTFRVHYIPRREHEFCLFFAQVFLQPKLRTGRVRVHALIVSLGHLRPKVSI